MRHDDADERNRPAERDRRSREHRRADEREPLGAPHVDAARLGGRRAEAHEIQHARQRRDRGERRAHRHQRHDDVGVAADVERSHHPADRAEGVGEIADDLHEPVQRAEERAEGHAGQEQHGARRAVPARNRHRVHDRKRDRRSHEARHRHRRDAEHRGVDVKRDHDDGAERRAGRQAERIGRRERVAQKRLEDDAGDGEAAADEQRRQHARQPRDEEHLRVDVVGERDRSIEDARQRDRRRAHERRGEARRRRDRTEGRDRDDDPPAQIIRRGQAAPR